MSLISKFVVCPNDKCRKVTLTAFLRPSEEKFIQGRGHVESVLTGQPKGDWRLLPASFAKVIPDYIPQVLRDDYREACAISDLSPKAAATLCRRCLQGMIRDYWGVNTKSNRLWDEMKEIKNLIDPGTWAAIVALKDLGNIGAHMEQDVNVIVDVEPEEAKLLINLIESLFEDWYVTRHQKEMRNASLKAAVERKKPRPDATSAGA
ncbi:DUF4145 domain-containing protein [Pandoraea iniqua]|uniref:DUF4145 domain-containing protein n=1 Tax=Pandoraea iniqua TaxID=2508288 RepID=UPI001240017D